MTQPQKAYTIKIGTSDFKKMVSEDTLFVDKTLLIERILEDAFEVLLITRPRRWGKTLNMSMLQYFFSVPVKDDGSIDEDEKSKRRAIFSKMKIGERSDIIGEHCGKYPTIFVSFKEIKSSDLKEIKGKIERLMQTLYLHHIYLQNSPKLSREDKSIFQKYLDRNLEAGDLEGGLHFLSTLLFKHFDQRAIILIDEYDTPMNDWYAKQLAQGAASQGEDEEYFEDILSLFRGIFSSALKDNIYIKTAIVTGILRIAKANLFSGLNNFGEDSVLDKRYAQYFGFREEEVTTLLHECDLDQTPDILNGMKSWYNGYNVGGLTIYNPWSIMNCLNNSGELKAYWVGTASTALLENALILDKFQEELQTLIEGGTVEMIADPKMVFADIRSSPNALYNLLLFSGYLTAETIENFKAATYRCSVRIPNREVLEVFEVSSMQWISHKFNIAVDAYSAFINELLKGDISLFTENLKNYLAVAASFFTSGPKNAEVFYNGFVLGLISAVSSDYIVETEKESGMGRADLILIPKRTAKHKNALILEFKFSKSTEDLPLLAKKALEQIETKNYAAKLKDLDVAKIFKVGLAFSGKEVEVAFQ